MSTNNSNNTEKVVSVIKSRMKIILIVAVILIIAIFNQILYNKNKHNNGADSANGPAPSESSQPTQQETWKQNKDMGEIMKKMGKDPNTLAETDLTLGNDTNIIVPDQIFDPAKHIAEYDYMVIKDGKEIPKKITWTDEKINFGQIDFNDPIGLGIAFADKYVRMQHGSDRKSLYKDMDKAIEDALKEVIYNPNLPLSDTINIGAVRVKNSLFDDQVTVRVVIVNTEDGNDADEYSYFDVIVKLTDDTWKVADFTIQRGDDTSGIHGGY